MTTNTYVALRTETVAVATGTVTFDLTGISGYTDLVLVTSTKMVTADKNLALQFNGDTGTNYSITNLYGSGSAAGSYRLATQSNMLLDNYAYINTTNFKTTITSIQNYSNTTTYKTVLSRANSASTGVDATVGLWRSTAAITSITLLTQQGGSNFAVGSTFSLYGIANADQGAAKATGGIITEDANYWYHTFGASGAFIPKQSLTCDVLVVAGGGSGTGGAYSGGGGGAGGLRYFASESVTATSYNVTVGAGATAPTASVTGVDGNNSQFGSLTVSNGGGGAGGGGAGANNGRAGGSGGGAASTDSSYGPLVSGGAASPSGQGNAGGSNGSFNAAQFHAGGGGGAGGAGQAAQSVTVAGNGGVGVSTYSSWGIAAGVGQCKWNSLFCRRWWRWCL